MVRICVFGLGEAGSIIAADLVGARAEVHAFDPADVATPDGVHRHMDPHAAVTGAEVIVSLTAAADAATALTQALDAITPATLYADCATAAPATERELARIAAQARLRFTDVALMGTVPGSGIRTPTIASGPHASTLAEVMAPLGMRIVVVGSEVGDASGRKLIRSVVVKGLAAVVIEALRAAQAAGVRDDAWAEMALQLTRVDEVFLRRIVAGSAMHATRRHEEMVAAAEMLADLDVDSTMTRATAASLARIMDEGLDAEPPTKEEPNG